MLSPLCPCFWTRSDETSERNREGILVVPPSPPAIEREDPVKNPHALSIRDFLQRFREKLQRYDSLSTVQTEDDYASPVFRQLKYYAQSSPLKPASTSSISSSGIPTINPEEFVMPGSELQKEMARSMRQHSLHTESECVICMDGFDPSNPRMPTLCGCGTNKTYFHLPCLYQWTEQCPQCPSCRQKLTWEEF